MKENKYDDEKFFSQYSRMSRSVDGLKGAGEWHVLKTMLPILKERECSTSAADSVGLRICGRAGGCIGIGDRSFGKDVGRGTQQKFFIPKIAYRCQAVEDFEYEPDTFDVVISSLTFHYLESFETVCRNVHRCLSKGGSFVFSVEHPVFTAYGTQDWYYGADGQAIHWAGRPLFHRRQAQRYFPG